MYANVIIDIMHEKLDRTFQYEVPRELEGKLCPGMQVSFPFGNGDRQRKGYVLELTEEPQWDPSKIKKLSGIAKKGIAAEGELIALACWLKEAYGCTMIQALHTVLPVRDRVQGGEKVYVRLAGDTCKVDGYLALCGKRGYRARARLIRRLKDCPEGLDTGRLSSEGTAGMPVIRALEQLGIVRCERREAFRRPEISKNPEYGRKELNEEQQAAVEAIWQNGTAAGREGKEPPVALLYGVTGSGKTEVYLELIRRTMEEGRQAIVLIPEIAMTYQTLTRFYTRFGDQVSVMNSRMSAGERYDQFERARRGEIQVMIGPRSALFAPFDRLGLIIVDEEHEGAYKSEQMPRYHARDVAIRRAGMCGAAVVLGSATPSVDSYWHAARGDYKLVRLPHRAGAGQLPRVYVEDMRRELREGNRSVFSGRLRGQMEACLQRGEQAMLFLNRRGYSGVLSCRSCGEAVKCPHCDVALAVHREGGQRHLVCHYCGYAQEAPKACPSCGSRYLSELRAGTQQIESLVRAEFPSARVLRMDMDTTRNKHDHERILSAFAAGEADILVGTQMIVKGHDFKNVTLVGVLAADMSLGAGDYRACERTFQLLTQAAGRAGRGERAGEVTIQTYQPEHYSIRLAAAQDYEGFYEREIAYRSLLRYPPCGHMLAVLASCREEEHLRRAVGYLKEMAERICAGQGVQVIGPAQSGIYRVKDVYRRNLFLKGGSLEQLAGVRRKLEKYIGANQGFDSVQIQFDPDPMQAL